MTGVWKNELAAVASGILPDVKGVRLAARIGARMFGGSGKIPARWICVRLFPPGWKPRLYGRRDARRYGVMARKNWLVADAMGTVMTTGTV